MPIQNDIRNENVEELLNEVPNWMIRYGNLLTLIFIIMFLAMSWLIKYPDVINTEARISTQIPPQKKYAQISGTIDSIMVLDNKEVKKGDIIAVIENTANLKHVKLLKSVVDTIKLNNQNFEFPIEDLPILFLGEIDTEYALFENNYIQYQLNKKLQPFSNEQKGNNITKSQLYARLNTLLSQKKINEVELIFQKKELERHRQLFEKGVIAKQAFEAKELSYLQSERSSANMDASISQIRESIGNTKINSITTSIKKTREEISLLKNVIQSFNQLKRALINWEMTYAITSGIDGKVAFSKLWSKNQAVNQGELLFTIIPKENSAFIAKLNTPAHNSGKIHKGQTVKIRLENYPDTEYGTINGKIESISLLPDENGFYLVTVSLPSILKTSYNKEIEFKYEMRGSAEIITEDLRMIERFFYQLKNIFNN